MFTSRSRRDYGGEGFTSLSDSDYGKPVFGGGESDTGPQEVTNVQKLSGTWSVGQELDVSDGFYVSGAGGTTGLWPPHGTSGGKPAYLAALPGADADGFYLYCVWVTGDGGYWLLTDSGGASLYKSAQDVAFPWLVTLWTDSEGNPIDQPTLTNPAHQVYNGPDNVTQGGCFVSGGTQDGVFVPKGAIEGKESYNLLGNENVQSEWVVGAPSKWVIKNDGGDTVYYSLSDVADPSLAIDWKNASDDSLAAITVTSFTAGQFAAGLKVGSTFYTVTTPTNGRNGYHDLLGVAPDYTFDGTKWTDGITDGSGNTAFPWDGGIGTRHDQGAEASYGETP